MNSKTLDFAIGGMHCAACSARIERVVGNMKEVDSVAVSLASNTAQVALAEEASDDPSRVAETVKLIEEKVGKLGFTVSLVDSGDGSVSSSARRWEENRAAQQAEADRRGRDLIPAILFALPLLILSMGEMAGMPLPEALSPALHPARFAFLQLLLCLPVIIAGRRFYLLGLPALFRKAPNMDTLVALGTGAAFLYSLWNTVALLFAPEAHPAVQQGQTGLWDMLFGSGHSTHGVELYYESAAVVIALVSLGKYMEARSKMRTSDAMKSLLDLSPETAFLLPHDSNGEQAAEAVEVPLAEVKPGDVLLVKPGGRIPVDGEVIGGLSHVDESMLTGESMPVEKKEGTVLVGGSINRQGKLVMRAERVGSDTVLARMVRLVQEAQGSKAPIAGLADRISLYFVPAVMAIALLSGLFWLFYGDSASFALRIFVSVMVIACPCAMGLATPMAIMVGTGRGAQLGVLFKNGEALERTAHIRHIVMDKTGTLTEGKPALIGIIPLGANTLEALPLLEMAASLERDSEHPLAAALTEAGKAAGLSPLPVSDFVSIPGRGVRGTIPFSDSNRSIALGNTGFARENMSQDCPQELIREMEEAASSEAAQGRTAMVLLVDNLPAGVFSVADSLRGEAPEVIRELSNMGIEAVMLTGDNEATARAIAAEAGINRVYAGVLPDGKERVVADLQNDGSIVGMVGDGVNDAPALARADVGIAMGGGIDVAVETGDVVLMKSGLRPLPTALRLGRRTMHTIKQNLFWAFAYNIVGIPFAAGVLYLFGGPVLSPMLAGAAMALSSVSVVTNSLRLRFFR